MRYIVRQPPGSTIIEAPTPLKSFDILAPMRSGMLGKRLYKDAIGRKWLGFVSSNGLSTRAARQAGATAASKTLKNGAEGADVIKSKKVELRVLKKDCLFTNNFSQSSLCLYGYSNPLCIRIQRFHIQETAYLGTLYS